MNTKSFEKTEKTMLSEYLKSKDVSEEVVKEIARKKPLRAVFRDSSFSNSASKINVFEIFKMISPETSVKVI